VGTGVGSHAQNVGIHQPHTCCRKPWRSGRLRGSTALLPRHLQIILEINHRLLDSVRTRFPGDLVRVQRVSLIEEGPEKHVRMANLAIVGSHSTNGVAAIHSQLLRTATVKDLADMFPERFSNKTNGVTTAGAWLLLANPALALLITDAIGDSWVTDLEELGRLRLLADDEDFRDLFRSAKRETKSQCAAWLRSRFGLTVDPDTMFDCQIKRIHEYKRQLLNALRIVVLYNRLRENPDLQMAPRTFFFAGKAAPAYRLAKLIVKFIHSLAATIDADPVVRGRLRVLFLPRPTMFHLRSGLIPPVMSRTRSPPPLRSQWHQQHEIHDERRIDAGHARWRNHRNGAGGGREEFLLFGLTADQVTGSRGWYDPPLAL